MLEVQEAKGRKGKKQNIIRPKHDKVFRKSLEIPMVARELIEDHLPKEVLSIIDLDTLKIEKESFIEQDLSENIADVLFSVRLKRDSRETGYIHLLCEHQSKPDKLMAFRLFKYMLAICDRHLAKHPKAKHLPLVYPIVLYNGKQKYNAEKNLWGLFEDTELAKKFWVNDHKVVNVHDIPDEELKEKVWSGLLQFFLKHIHERDLLKRWEQVKDMLPRIASVNIGYNYISVILSYTLTSIEKDDRIEVRKLLVDSLREEGEAAVMTSIAEEWYNDGFKGGILAGRKEGILAGMEKGIEKGREEGMYMGQTRGKLEVARNMLLSGFDINLISEITGLPMEEINSLNFKKESLHC